MPLVFNPVLPVPPEDIPLYHARSITPGNNWHGPFVYGSLHWAFGEVGQNSLNFSGDWNLVACYATAGTNAETGTWTEADWTNHPIGHEANASPYWDGTSSLVYLAYKRQYNDQTRQICLTSFNMNTKAWGTTVESGLNPGGGYTGSKMIRLSGGTFIILTNTGTQRDATDFPTQGVHYITYNGTAWSTANLVSADSANYNASQIQLSAGDLTHFYYWLSGFSTNTYFHRALDSAGNLGTEQEILRSLTAHAIGVPTTYSGTLAVPYSDDGTATTSYYPWVAFGSLATNTDPTWSSVQVSSSTRVMPPFTPDNASIFNWIMGGTDLYTMWVTQQPPTGTNITNDIVYAHYNGTSFDTPVLYYTDTSSTYSVSTNVVDFFHNPSVTLLDAGTDFAVLIDRIHYPDVGTSGTGTHWEPVDQGDDVEPPFPVNKQRSWLESGTSGRLWKLEFAYETSGPPVALNGPYNLRFYRSINGGQTWIEQDSANRPTDVEAGGAALEGTTFYVGYNKQLTAGTHTLFISTFNTTSRTWGTATATDGTYVTSGFTRRLYVARANSKTYLLYNELAGGTHVVNYNTYDGTNFGTAIVITGTETGTYRVPAGVLTDGTLVHFWFKSGGAAVPVSLYHRTLDGTTLHATQQLGTLASDWSTNNVDNGQPIIWDTKLIVPYPRTTTNTSTDTLNSGYEHVPAIFIGDPSGTTTSSWTTEDVSTTLADWSGFHNSYSVQVGTSVSGTSTRLWAYWTTPQAIFVQMNDLYRAYKDVGGTWTGEELYFDPITPTNPEFDDFLSSPDLVTNNSGNLVVSIARVNDSFNSGDGNEYSMDGVIANFTQESWSVMGYLHESAAVAMLVYTDGARNALYITY